MLEHAKRLEEADEDLCDTEEDKVAFRAFKAKFVAVYRKLATTKPKDVVYLSSRTNHPVTLACLFA